MPLYEIGCGRCGRTETVVRSVAEYDDLPFCCGVKMRRHICAPYIQPDNTCYRSMATGEMITGRRQHREHLKNHNLIEVGNETPTFRPKGLTTEDKIKLRREIAQRLDTHRR